MKIVRFDSVGGASGDMVLAALAGLGADVDAVRAALASLPIESFSLDLEPATDRGITGQRARVTVADEPHPHRTLRDIRALLDGANIPDTVRSCAVATFERLAAAEARVHGTTVEEVHFHEVGAMDAIVDVVGACLALDSLGVDGVAVGPLPVGCGTVSAGHGELPVPVPAVVELLGEHPIVPTEEPFELVTPTGAALLMTWKESFRSRQRRDECQACPAAGGVSGVRNLKTANGIGHRQLNGRPNLLRAMLLETRDQGPRTKDLEHKACLVLECNLDDTVPELLGTLTQKLLNAGALDVFTTPVQMKKQRPGTLLTVLCDPVDRDTLLDLVFTESTTFGVREYATQRTCLERRIEQVETPYGTVRMKIGTWKGRDITRAPEHDDCVACAEAHGIAVRTVYEAALRG